MELNTGGWVAPPLRDAMGLHYYPTDETMLSIPVVSVDRDSIHFPMPALSAIIVPAAQKRWYWYPKTVWYVVVRQYGKDNDFRVGPFARFDAAKRVHQEFYAWYSRMYNAIIRTYKATERNKK